MTERCCVCKRASNELEVVDYDEKRERVILVCFKCAKVLQKELKRDFDLTASKKYLKITEKINAYSRRKTNENI